MSGLIDIAYISKVCNGSSSLLRYVRFFPSIWIVVGVLITAEVFASIFFPEAFHSV